MNDEIKEILDYLNIKGKKMIGIKQKELLLDYIANLQEENKKLDSQNTINILYWKKLEQRIDKAIEYINNKWKKDKYYEDIENCMTFCLYDKDNLLNILQGEDKDE